MAYIGLGSNLDCPEDQIRNARLAIQGMPGVQEYAVSSLYRSPPMGPKNQPDFVNAVMAVETILSAEYLLHGLHEIERNQGRTRNEERWGARTLDLDLLLYGERKIKTAKLTIPHYGIAERSFVLYPLFEIAPDIAVPGKGTVRYLLSLCPRDGLIKAGKI